ncbi:filamentous hemagglutinin N-terminal domain-containing protein [[Phormidium] sp. ETS-05]|uniref:two-partner secretion domain-containing protein n=1 Tax=[Phormidium] sp. ETS-05 TaxID=222819 RepID=UPI0018EF0C41|nr:filamentous hemagglutinin N-terminal domain-containing protein [[Phormidium] sp. ETS-05]
MKSSLYWLICLVGTISAWLSPWVTAAWGQITPDGTLPTAVTTTDNANFTIEGGTRVGDNLFHSFREFSVPTGGSALFNNAPDATNIISRITGGNASQIDGLIKTNGTANLFLLNPAGIIFGLNASLDVGGSFLATSATTVKFADGIEYSTTNPAAPPLLTVSVPVGLQFGANPGPIVNRSQADPDASLGGVARGLKVPANRTLALVGGEVRVEGGNVTPFGGRLELGSVGSNSNVEFNADPRGFALTYDDATSFQDILISGGAFVDVTDFSATVGSGALQVQGRRVSITEGAIISSFTLGSVAPGTIFINASEVVEVSGFRNRFGSNTSSSIATTTIGDGNAGDITITTPRLIVREGGGIFTSSVSSSGQAAQTKGGAGNLTVVASEVVEISGSSAAGLSRVNVETRTDGDAGALRLTTGRLLLQDGGQLSAATSRGTGRGGTITVVASESMELTGRGFDDEGKLVPSQLTGISEGAGDAGNVSVTTGTLRISNDAQLAVSATGTGAAGNLQINTRNLELDNVGSIRAESAAGNKGSIEIGARDLVLRRGSSITTNATGQASGGNITVNGETIAALEASRIAANAVVGAGGNIGITTSGLFLSPDSTITASSQFGISGNIRINNPDVDPASGLIALAANVVDADRQFVSSCATDEEGSFTITGRGGLPPNPTGIIRAQTVWRDFQDYAPTGDSQNISTISQPKDKLLAASAQPGKIIEVTGWVVDAAGNVNLVAASNMTPDSFRNRARNCYGW